MKLPALLTLACVGVVTLSACGSKKPEPAPAPVPAATVPTNTAADRARADSIERAEAARRDSIARAAALQDSINRANAAAQAAEEEARSTMAAAVHFELDQSDLSSEDRALLDRKATILTRIRGLRIRVEGNADDRGSDEYNLALSMRRAAETRRYLLERGVSEGQVETMSNGEEKPVCQEPEEGCWARNRRAEFTILAGGEHLVLP
jgi:peptidoglycan-associated lipoprotein